MTENEFLIDLNKMTIADKYDNNYFNNIFDMLKKFYQADNVVFDGFRKEKNESKEVSMNDIVFNIDFISKRIIVKNVKKIFNNKEFFLNMTSVILNNIFKNYMMIEKLKKDKYLDSLLTIYNRLAYDELLKKNEVHKCCGVAFIDVNGLGIVNNMYGYDAGDKLLVVISDCFKKFYRYDDIYRIGGDELVIICDDIDKKLFDIKLQRSLEDIALTPYSVSVGTIYNENIVDLQQTIKDASVIMKRNKEEYRRNNPDKYANKYEVTYVGNVKKK